MMECRFFRSLFFDGGNTIETENEKDLDWLNIITIHFCTIKNLQVNLLTSINIIWGFWCTHLFNKEIKVDNCQLTCTILFLSIFVIFKFLGMKIFSYTLGNINMHQDLGLELNFLLLYLLRRSKSFKSSMSTTTNIFISIQCIELTPRL